jgi:LmbE family N-acetylglucosaminyl deacetylase
MRPLADRERWDELSQRLFGNRVDPDLKVAVLAAHPDDETIGASVLLGRCSAPDVIYLTDGAPRDSKLWSPEFRGSREEYAFLRRAEAERALSLAAVKSEQIHWMGATDQEAIFSASQLAAYLTGILEVTEPDVIVTHPYEGGHPDHDTAALVASLALARLTTDRAPTLIEMTSYHARAGQFITGEFLPSRVDRDVAKEVRVELSAADQERKRGMFAAYSSQARVLNEFSIERERFRLAPDYDFSRPPHEGKLWYECMGWSITGERWRALAAQCIAGIQEPAWR